MLKDFIHKKTGNIYHRCAIALVDVPAQAMAAIYYCGTPCDLGRRYLAKNTEFDANNPDANPQYLSSIELFRVMVVGGAAIVVPITEFESVEQAMELDQQWSSQPVKVWLREYGLFEQKFTPAT